MQIPRLKQILFLTLCPRYNTHRSTLQWPWLGQPRGWTDILSTQTATDAKPEPMSHFGLELVRRF